MHSLEAAASANTGGHFFDLWKGPIPVRRSKTPYSMALRVSLRRPSTSPSVDGDQRGVVLRLVSRVGQ